MEARKAVVAAYAFRLQSRPKPVPTWDAGPALVGTYYPLMAVADKA